MCTVTQVAVSTDEFSERLLGMVNGAALSLMISIGHRTGLFDTMATLPASDSHQIAVAAGLNERYVREWLGAMATGRIVDYDAQSGKYSLPEAHAAVLTRAATPGNMATVTQWIAVLGSVEDGIVDCFRKGGGIHYSAFSRFHAVMAEESGQTTVAALEDAILPLMPEVVDRLSQGISVLDIGCGSGRAMMRMAELYPNSSFFGYDLCADAVQAAMDEAASRGLSNIRFELRDVSRLDDVERFGLITAFDAIHDQARPDVVLGNIRRALEPEGVFLMQDIRACSHVEGNYDNPLAPLIYTISCMHCMSVSLAQGGMGLGAAWGKEVALQMLREAGFDNVRVEDLPHDIQNLYYVCKKQ